MDVTFTNVLEGARQYFQGLPTGSNSAASPAYSSESHLRHEYDRSIPPSSNPYWSSYPTDTTHPTRDHNTVQRDHTPIQRDHASVYKDQTVIHRPSSHSSDSSSRPSSHLSQYAQSVPVSHEQSRQYYTGYQEHYQQHVHQQQPVKEQPQQQQQFQQHQSQQHQSQPHQRQSQQHPASQQPPGHFQQSRQSFEFSRPQARDTPNYSHYQSHISAASASYQQSPSPYHQVPSPQQPRAPSREQMVPRVPSREQTIPRVPSQEQLVSRTSQPQYSQPSETYSYSQSLSYYQQPQPKVTTSNMSYKPSTQPQYPPTSQQQQNMYYKHIYGPQQSHQSVFAASRQEDQNTSQHSDRNNSVDQSIRTTHNLPPIATISKYHSSRVREPVRTTSATTINRTRTFSTSSYTSGQSIPVTSSIIQQNPAVSVPNYSNHRINNSQHYQPVTTVVTQSYTNVIMTTSNTSSNNYYNSNQSQSSSQHFQHSGIPSRNISNEPPSSNMVDNTSRVIVKRESPLDLSVKTVRTPADSTLIDADHEARNKYLQNHRPIQTLSTHNYPQLDVNSFQRNLTQRSSQLKAATAPKVEFRPNFNVPTLSQPRKSLEEPRRSSIPEKTHSNNKLPTENKNVEYRYPTASVPTAAHVNSYIRAAPKTAPRITSAIPAPRFSSNDHLKKRTADIVIPPTVPNKVPKLTTDTWRQSIDLQIEERLSSYKQQQAKLVSPTKNPLVNGAYPDKPINVYPGYEKSNYESVSQHSTYNQYQPQNNHIQTYVPSAGTHQYPSYNPTPTSNSYLQVTSRSNNNPALNTLSNSKSTVGGAVDKRVLSLLRNSLEVKGQKKLEQQKSNENFSLRSDIQHPSTDVTAPLQPKPVFVSRNNVSPFTPTSYPDNSNMTAAYKFHIPKAVDSVNFESNKTNQLLEKQTQDTVIINNHNNVSSECDGLAAFLAARIRTKGELKQGGIISQNISSNKSHLHEVIEKQLKSPIKQDMLQGSVYSSSSQSSTPPKLQKERLLIASAPRKRLFSRNEEDLTNNSIVPPREPGLRSSSETSVFDFPDSDSENDINRESLEAMRKCRKSTKVTIPVCDIKQESTPRVSTPGDDLFSQLCDNFLEQLKSGVVKRKCKKKKEIEQDSLSQVEYNEKSLDPKITVKIEITDVLDTKEVDQENEMLVETKAEISKNASISVVEPEVDLTKVKSEPLSIQVDSKHEDIFLIKRKSVRRRILSSSDNETGDKNKSVEKSETIIEQTDIISTTTEIKSEIVEKVKHEVFVKKTTGVIEDAIVKEKVNAMEDTGNHENSGDKENNDTNIKELESPQKTNELASVVRPSKKPCFGDGSDFYPGWEEGVYKYKKSLRMPPTLIQVTRPPVFHRLSTSLPDLDPCPQSPTTSISCDDKDLKLKEKRIKSEPDSDTESNSDFNIFAKKTNYDSEGSSSIKSLPNTGKETSILDRLLEKCGGRKRKKYKRKDDHSPKTVPKAENAVELLPTPSLEIKEEDDKKTKKLSNSPVIKAESPLLGFRKSTMSNFKDAFLKRSNNILNNQFTTVVLNSRTRRETRVQKQRATIKEVFGEDRPASAPPVTCVNDIQIKEEISEETNSCLGNLVVRLEKKDNLIERVADLKREIHIKNEQNKEKQEHVEKNQKDDNLVSKELKASIKTEIEEDSIIDDDTRSLDDVTVKSETPSIDGDDGGILAKKRGKFGKMRRKFSSGFDYIRKKKKVKKESVESETVEKKKKKLVVSKTLESVDDIQKEIKTWVLNKGIGETHLHRAARLGYTDVTAYCLEKTDCPPSPRDNAGYTPLHWACSKGHLQIAKLLLLYGANPSESAQGGIRPLHEAVENGFVEIARLLLSYGADPTLATYSGLTPLALTNDEVTKDFLMNHLNDIEGEVASQWNSSGPASIFDPVDLIGFNVLDNVPSPDPEAEEEDVDFEMSESLLPNLYTLCNEPPTDRWVLLQDLSTILKIKSRDALLKQICPASTSSVLNHRHIIRELRMPEFLDQARCCQFLNAGEKINTRATKIALVRYTDKVRELLNIESVVITAR